jgi:NADH dehydrogenase
LNFVVVGGGPTGVELAGAIRDIASLYMGGDYRHIDTKATRVLLVEGGPHILPSYPADLQAKAVEQLKQLGVEVMTNKIVTDLQPGYVVIGKEASQERIESLVTLWAAGVQASPLGRILGAPVHNKGSVIVDRFLNPPGMPNVFVCGDLADVTENGRQIPGVAQPAMQMGTQAAHMIQADLDGRPRKHFHYFDKGDMATIGRNRAVADVKWPFKAHWGGFLAWASWLVVHIYFLIGFRNRILVLIQWGWAYLAQGHGARLIMGNQSLPGWDRLVPERPTASDRPLDLASPAVSDPVAESPSQTPAQIGNPAGAAQEKVTV